MDLSFLEINKLYVIGNGFDRHHDMPCSYDDFKRYLTKYYPEVYANLTRLYGDINADWWRTFEESLANFNPDKYPKEVADESFFDQLNELVSRYGQKGRDIMDQYEVLHKDSPSNKYARAELMVRFEMMELKKGLNDAFGSWVKSLKIPDESKKLEGINPNALFFTFNYTRTLEDLYGVDDELVVHLHGSIDNNVFIIGHNRTAEEMMNQDLENNVYKRDLDIDSAEDDARNAMFIAAEDFKKPVEDIIYQHRADFNSLDGIKEIEIKGFSYSPIDLPYLERVLEITGKYIKVIFNWHTEHDMKNAKNFIQKEGLTNSELVYF